MNMMLPTSELPKAQRSGTDRLVAAGSRESVEAAIASAQQRQPTNGLTTARRAADEAATAFVRERGS